MDKNPDSISKTSVKPTLKIFENYTQAQAKELLDTFNSHLHEDIQL
jgi:hypothetical protein